MSMTISRGLRRKADWMGVAASVAEYLNWFLTNSHEGKRFPAGSIRALRQFFEFVIEGYNLGHKRPGRADIPLMAGITSWHIAVEVITAIHQAEPKHDEVVLEARAFIAILQKFESSTLKPNDVGDIGRLFEFSKQLMHMGLADADAQTYESWAAND
jgi:hypothetical protein